VSSRPKIGLNTHTRRCCRRLHRLTKRNLSLTLHPPHLLLSPQAGKEHRISVLVGHKRNSLTHSSWTRKNLGKASRVGKCLRQNQTNKHPNTKHPIASHGKRVTLLSIILAHARPRVAGEDTRVTHSSRPTGGDQQKQSFETCVTRHHDRCIFQTSRQSPAGQNPRAAPVQRSFKRPQRPRREISEHTWTSGTL
jgi:hypothetical protein